MILIGCYQTTVYMLSSHHYTFAVSRIYIISRNCSTRRLLQFINIGGTFIVFPLPIDNLISEDSIWSFSRMDFSCERIRRFHSAIPRCRGDAILEEGRAGPRFNEQINVRRAKRESTADMLANRANRSRPIINKPVRVRNHLVPTNNRLQFLFAVHARAQSVYRIKRSTPTIEKHREQRE